MENTATDRLLEALDLITEAKAPDMLKLKKGQDTILNISSLVVNTIARKVVENLPNMLKVDDVHWAEAVGRGYAGATLKGYNSSDLAVTTDLAVVHDRGFAVIVHASITRPDRSHPTNVDIVIKGNESFAKAAKRIAGIIASHA